MADLILEWLNLAFRWFHVVAAIAWIGASFYFIWLDLSLREPPEWKKEKGVKGDLWAIHGGGIYEVAKYQVRPEVMPQKLHWFKWEAYSTWLSGSCLLILMYYFQAQSYLVGYQTWIQSPGTAIVASILFIACAQIIYEILLRTPLVKKGLVFAVALLCVITFASWLAHHLFSARAAFLHIGAMIATWMAGNVVWGIMPAQRKFVAAVSAHEAPPIKEMLFAKLRSTHNNYLTLPVIFCMISNHYSFVYGHPYSWLGLVAIGSLLAWGRHFFNLKHLGLKKPSILISSFLGLVLVAIIMTCTNKSPSQTTDEHSDLTTPTVATQQNAEQEKIQQQQQALQIVGVHCAGCHSQHPTQVGFPSPPAGLIINDLAQLNLVKIRALPALKSGYMPLGNLHQMSELERKTLITWLESQ